MLKNRFWLIPVIALLWALLGTTVLAQDITIVFTFWGTVQEKEAVEAVARSYEESHPGVHIDAQHVPGNYDERILTMLAAGDPPDLAYMTTPLVEELVAQDMLLDFGPVFENDPEASQYLPQLQFHFDGVYVGDAIAGEVMVMYYNKDMFDEAGLEYPPSNVDEAWSWEEFVDVAKTLTTDRNGNNAHSEYFDPENVATFGVNFQTWWGGWMTAVLMGGSDFMSDDGTELLLNQPEAVDGLQKFQDLIYVDHVAPSPDQLAAASSANSDVLMQTGQLAMLMNGHWKILDYSQMDDLNWGIGVLPVINEPITAQIPAPIVAFADTEHPDVLIDFYKFLRRPEQVDLYQKGLWMPISADYYTDEELVSNWLDGEPGVYPPEAREVLIDYAYNYSQKQLPVVWLRNQSQILAEAIEPAISLIWTGEATAQEAMDQAVSAAEPLLQGRSDR